MLQGDRAETAFTEWFSEQQQIHANILEHAIELNNIFKKGLKYQHHMKLEHMY